MKESVEFKANYTSYWNSTYQTHAPNTRRTHMTHHTTHLLAPIPPNTPQTHMTHHTTHLLAHTPNQRAADNKQGRRLLTVNMYTVHFTETGCLRVCVSVIDHTVGTVMCGIIDAFLYRAHILL